MVSLSHVVGNDKVRKELEIICDVAQHPNESAALNPKLPRGILLYGEEGTGKSFMAQALLHDLGRSSYIAHFDVDGNNLSAYLKEVFEKAVQAAPSCVLVEGIDQISDASDGGGMYAALENCFELAKGHDVLVVATAVQIDHIPESLLLPGYFDFKFQLFLATVKDAAQFIAPYLQSSRFDKAIDPVDIAKMFCFCPFSKMAGIFDQAALYAAHEQKAVIAVNYIIHAYLLYEYQSRYDPDFANDPTQHDEEYEQRVYHEAGHLVALELVSPGNVAFAYVYPKESGFVRHCDYTMPLDQDILFTLAGMAADDLQFGCVGTGNSCDFQTTMDLLKTFVIEDASLGFHYLSPFAENTSALQSFSQETAIMHELNSRYIAVKKMLAEHRSFLDAVAKELHQKHVLLNSDVRRIVASLS